MLSSLKYPGSKWLKHLALWKHPQLQPHLPQTELLSSASLKHMIKTHPIVFIKPVIGGGGRGILKVSSAGAGQYTLQHAGGIRTYSSLPLLIKFIQSQTASRQYLIQQGVDLIRIGGRAMDFRILMLKPARKWKVMGVMGKLAARNKHVTNYCRGGSWIRLEDALTQSIGCTPEDCRIAENELRAFAETIAGYMDKEFPNIDELGLDIAIDGERRIWLLEANTKPQYKLFLHHPDPRLYSKISAMIRALRYPGHMTSPRPLVAIQHTARMKQQT
ncbi:YheC/YheD family protein [Paenibacillus sp. y28]|uniref:YheC/YheD family protein n=1 Tax=Paenibacillus sp. y28 TaxID=3129110 RepID=UPI0030177CC6